MWRCFGSGDDKENGDISVSMKIDTVKIKEYIDKVLEQPEGMENNYITLNNEIVLNEMQKLIIKYISISCYTSYSEPSYISLEGYLLTKNR